MWSRLAVGTVVDTARFPRTAKCLQLGGRVESERVPLARIHIPQLGRSTLEQGSGGSGEGSWWRRGGGLVRPRACRRWQAAWADGCGLCVRDRVCPVQRQRRGACAGGWRVRASVFRGQCVRGEKGAGLSRERFQAALRRLIRQGRATRSLETPAQAAPGEANQFPGRGCVPLLAVPRLPGPAPCRR